MTHHLSKTATQFDKNPRELQKKSPSSGIGKLIKSNKPKPWRVVFYSHDTSGLGHIRRNILMAKMLVREFDQTSVLLITGAKDVSGFDLPEGIDFVVLPSLRKKPDGGYHPGRLKSSLKKLIDLRSGIIKSAVRNFAPDVLIVDQMPRGVLNELDATLKYVNSKKKIHCILGLRDILDEQAVIRNEWAHNKDEKYILKYYEQVWIFGDPAVYDAINEYGFSTSVAKKTHYTGYLDPRKHLQKRTLVQGNFSCSPHFAQEKYNLCLVGSGQDGEYLAEAFALAVQLNRQPSIILAGPAFPEEALLRIQQISDECSNLNIIRFHNEPTELLKNARTVITLGGYNSICEILSYNKRALIVPRIRPRKEQLIRALILEKLGLVNMLHPDHLSKHSLMLWLKEANSPALTSRFRVNFDGLDCVIDLLDRIKGSAA